MNLPTSLTLAFAGFLSLLFYLFRRRRAVLKVEPALRGALLYAPLGVPHPALIGPFQKLLSAFLRPTSPVPGVTVRRERIAAADGHQTTASVYDPQDRSDSSGALLWFHGGGHIAGMAYADHVLCSRIAQDLSIVVVSVDYRLAPSHPFPADLNDGFAALEWLVGEARGIRVDPERIAVGGTSAGGGLAASLAQRARDAGIPLAFQLLVYPMLDDRTTLRRDHAGRGRLLRTPSMNLAAWTAYLGRRPASDDPPPSYAASPAWRTSGTFPRLGSASATSISSSRRVATTPSACVPPASPARSTPFPACFTGPTTVHGSLSHADEGGPRQGDRGDLSRADGLVAMDDKSTWAGRTIDD